LEGDQGRVKRIRIDGDEPNEVVMLVCMEISQGNSLCNYLYLNLAKHHVFLFIIYLFSSTKLENRRKAQLLLAGKWDGRHGGRGMAPVGGGGGRESW
jgi:hypothetical protein